MALYIPPRPPIRAIKASPTGPGAGVLMTEFPLSTLGNQNTPQQKMRQALRMGVEVPWIRSAELIIAGKIQALPWHIEDGDGNTVDDDYVGTDAQDLRTLIEKPTAALPVGQQMFRTQQWRRTARHIGLTGDGFWYLDGMNTYGNPSATLDIRPDRMTPNEDNNGNLVSWQLDKTATSPGLTLSLEETMHFMFDPPDVGHFGIGLVESALLWMTNSQGLDRHTSMLISSGGRLSGILSPKSGVVGPEQSLQIERDWRTIVDTSDAAKRLQILNAPVDFMKMTLTPAELQLAEMLTLYRDNLLALWHIPLTAIGIHERGSSISAGAAKVTETDDQTVWENAVKARTAPFLENLQARLADPYQAQGNNFVLVLDYPTFDDNSQTYIDSQQALNQPITNNERRDILGLDPIDPAIIGISGGPLGDEVWMPATQVYAFSQAPGIKPPEPTPQAIATPGPTEQMDSASLAAGETTGAAAKPPTKASITPSIHPRFAPLHTSLVNLRNRIAASKTPIIKRNVHNVLEDQKREIATRLRKSADHIAKNPGDTSTWFPAKSFDAKLSAALTPHLTVMADSVNAQIHDVLPARKAAPAGAVERVLTRGAARITGINETTRQKVNEAIYRALEAGSTIGDVADAIEGIGTTTIGDLDMGALFDEYRAEMIARTELMDAYNASAIASYSDAGFDTLQAIDGDGDPECAERDGQIYSSDEADSIEDHPNGTLDWVPVIDDNRAAAAVEEDAPVKASTAAAPRSIADAIAAIGASHSEDMAAGRAVHTDAMASVIAGFSTLGDQIAALASVGHPITLPEGSVQVAAPGVTVNAPVTVQEGETHVHVPAPAPRTIKRDNVGNVIGIE